MSISLSTHAVDFLPKACIILTILAPKMSSAAKNLRVKSQSNRYSKWVKTSCFSCNVRGFPLLAYRHEFFLPRVLYSCNCHDFGLICRQLNDDFSAARSPRSLFVDCNNSCVSRAIYDAHTPLLFPDSIMSMVEGSYLNKYI